MMNPKEISSTEAGGLTAYSRWLRSEIDHTTRTRSNQWFWTLEECQPILYRQIRCFLNSRPPTTN